MRMSKLLRGLSILSLLFCAAADFGQTSPPSPVPLITQVTPPSLTPAPSPSQIVQFSLTIVGANFPSNPVVKLTLPEGPSLYAASASANATGTQIEAQFNTTLPRPAVYALTVANSPNNPTQVSNVFYLPVTPTAVTVGISQNSTEFLTGYADAMAIGDFNGDGNVDVAFVSQGSDTLSIFLGTFGGYLNSGATYPTGFAPSGIVAADLNGDGVLDLAFTSSNSNTITVLLGNGDGTFRPGSTISDPGTYPTGIVAADLNGDGFLDLAVVNACGPVPALCYPEAGPPGPGSLLVLLGKGDGTFSISPSYPSTGNVPSTIAAADLNSDGIIDLVVTNQTDNNATLLMGNGDGTFTPAQSPVPTGNGPSGIAIADFNGDGKLDLAVTNSADNTISILLSQSCGVPANACTFSAAPISPMVGLHPIAVSAADMNADGFVDLVVANQYDSSITVLLGNRAGGFTPVFQQGRYSFSIGGTPAALALADFSGDGRLDVATVNNNGSFSILIQTAVPQVLLTSSNTTPPYGLFVTFTVNVNPSFGAQPTGTVTLFDGTTSLGTASLSGYQANFFLSSLNAGTHQITATYNGDANFLATTSAAVTETVSQAQTTVTLNSDVNTVPFGQAFTLTANVQPQNTGAPTGTVNFFDIYNSTSLGSATLANGVAQLTLSNLSPGAHVIRAIYDGDSNFTGSSSPTYQENITQTSTTTTVTTSATPVNLGQTPTFTATVQPSSGTTATGFVTFIADGSTQLGTAQVTNNKAQLQAPVLSVGSHSITAQYTGDTNYTGSTSPVIQETVNPAADTVSVSASSTFYGQPSTFVATVQPVGYSGTPTGTITFSDGTTVLGTGTLSNGSAQFTTSTLTVGSHPISASYSGDSNFQPITSAQATANVLKANATTTVTSGQNPSSFGQAVLMTAAVQPVYGGTATGSVTLLDGSVTLGTSTLSGNAAVLSVASLSAGTHSITASYAGDSNVASSTSVSITQTVNPLPTSLTLTSSANPTTYGRSVTLSATVQSSSGTPTGSVTFLDGTTILGTATLASAGAQLTVSNLGAGSHSLTANYSGDVNFTASTSSVLTETVNQMSTTTTLASSLNPATAAQAVTLTASVQAGVGSSAAGTVTFMDGSVTLGTATVTNNSAQLTVSTLAAGSHTITAVYSGSTNFGGSTSAALTETINQSSTTTTLVSNVNPGTFGQAVPFVANVQTASGGSATGPVTFFDGATTLGTATVSNSGGQHNVAQFTFSGLQGGTHTITAAYGGDPNYTASTSSALTETINPASSTVTLGSSSNPASFGQMVILTTTVVPSVSGATATGTVTFFDGASSLGTANLSNNVAQISMANFALGSHLITATYAGDRNFAGSTSAALAEVVNPAATSTVVSSSANPALVKTTVTFTATVSSPIVGTQSGKVNFYLDGSSTAAASVNLSNGTAKYSTNSLSAGTHSIVAVFTSTNTDFAGSTSPTFTQFVSDFTVAVSPSSLTVTHGTSGTYTLTLTPVGEFSGTITLSCGGAPGGTTCAIVPTQVPLSGSGSAHATVTITAAQNASKGTHTLTFTGTSGGLNYKITASLTID